MLVDKINAEMRTVMKGRVSMEGAERENADLRLKTLRSMLAAVNNAQVAGKQRVDLNKAQIEDVLRKLAKSRRDNATEYVKAGAQDRADVEVAEANIIDEFLPELLDENDTRVLVKNIIDERGLAGVGNRGIGIVVKELKLRGDVDTTLASKIAKEYL